MSDSESRGIYRVALLIPLAGLAVAAWIRGGTAPGLPVGWEWLYPASVTRGLVAYALVAVWLWVEIGRRSIAELHRLIWLAPLVYVALLWVMLLLPVLARGRAGELWSEHAGAILVRTFVHLAIGYACVVLLHVARRVLEESEG